MPHQLAHRQYAPRLGRALGGDDVAEDWPPDATGVSLEKTGRAVARGGAFHPLAGALPTSGGAAVVPASEPASEQHCEGDRAQGEPEDG